MLLWSIAAWLIVLLQFEGTFFFNYFVVFIVTTPNGRILVANVNVR